MRLLFFLFAFFVSWVPQARGSDIFAFVGAGPALAFPGTIRVGVNDWEGGMQTSFAYGIDKIFRFDWKYMAFGLTVVPFENIGVGFYGGAGIEPKLFLGLTFRAELNAVAATNGYVKGEAYAGLGFHF